MPPGPPGRARFPVAGGSGAGGRAVCGRSVSFGRRRDGAGRVGIAGTAEVPGADGSSILSRILGGTIRPGMDGTGVGALTAGGTGAAATRGSSTTGGDSGSTSATGAAGNSSTGGSASGLSSTAAAGLAVFTRRGGASDGATGFTGSGFLKPGAGFFPFAGGPSANMSPPGSVMPRSRARRSTNCRATTSSRVLEALFSSMPCARFNSASTSWLLVLSSSATL